MNRGVAFGKNDIGYFAGIDVMSLHLIGRPGYGKAGRSDIRKAWQGVVRALDFGLAFGILGEAHNLYLAVIAAFLARIPILGAKLLPVVLVVFIRLWNASHNREHSVTSIGEALAVYPVGIGRTIGVNREPRAHRAAERHCM